MTLSSTIVLCFCLVIMGGSFILSIYTIKRKLFDACFNTWYTRKGKDKCTDKHINEIIYAEYDTIYATFALFWVINVVFTIFIMCSVFDLW
jgi:hypothetical protein